MTFPDISPVAVSIFGFEIRWYALAYIFGFVFGFEWIKRQLKATPEMRVSESALDRLLTYGIVGVLVGGRLGYCMFYNPASYMANPLDILKIWEGGMSFHGGFAGACAALILWCRQGGHDLAKMSDMAALAAPIGIFLGRAANFVNAELYGRKTSSVFGVVFPGTDGAPRHPSQLYEAALEGAALFVILNLLARSRAVRARPGILAALFACGYSLARIAVEFVREPDAQLGYLYGGATMGQLLTIPVFVAGAGAAAWLWRRKRDDARFVASPMLLDVAGHAFFTRQGGGSEGAFATNNARFETSDPPDNVRENRRRSLGLFGIDADKSLVTLRQEHTARVVVIDAPAPSVAQFLTEKADAVITNQRGLAVGVLTADCVPALVASADKKWVAAVHCGWAGIYAGVIEATMDELEKLGVKASDLRVALGPCIKQESYEVNAWFKEKILAADKSAARLFKAHGEKFVFDLAGWAQARFARGGVKKIDVMPFDNFIREDLFFSYRRRSRQVGGDASDSGRMLSAVWL